MTRRSFLKLGIVSAGFAAVWMLDPRGVVSMLAGQGQTFRLPDRSFETVWYPGGGVTYPAVRFKADGDRPVGEVLDIWAADNRIEDTPEFLVLNGRQLPVSDYPELVQAMRDGKVR